MRRWANGGRRCGVTFRGRLCFGSGRSWCNAAPTAGTRSQLLLTFDYFRYEISPLAAALVHPVSTLLAAGDSSFGALAGVVVALDSVSARRSGSRGVDRFR